jgi:hypothetical protein
MLSFAETDAIRGYNRPPSKEISMTPPRASAIVLAALSALAMLADIAAAGGHAIRRDRGYDGLDRGTVTAVSKFGNGSVTAPVRMTANGPQVRHPGGAWYYCRRSCSETLRVETVDVFEAQAGYGAECGVLGCLELVWPR